MHLDTKRKNGTKKGRQGSPRVDEAYSEIKRRILENIWPPGYSEFEPQVASSLGLSRTPVREALLRLENEGLVRMVPRRGMYVVPLSAQDMSDIYDVLASLESTAAELFARREKDSADLSELDASVVAMDAALARDDLDAWGQADEAFHRLLVDLCGNRRLAEMAATVSDQAQRARMISLRLRPKPVDSTAQHSAILEAIRAGDWQKAGRLTKRHRLNGKKMLLKALEHFRLPQL